MYMCFDVRMCVRVCVDVHVLYVRSLSCQRAFMQVCVFMRKVHIVMQLP